MKGLLFGLGAALFERRELTEEQQEERHFDYLLDDCHCDDCDECDDDDYDYPDYDDDDHDYDNFDDDDDD
jgi:hypothetical protein